MINENILIKYKNIKLYTIYNFQTMVWDRGFSKKFSKLFSQKLVFNDFSGRSKTLKKCDPNSKPLSIFMMLEQNCILGPQSMSKLYEIKDSIQIKTPDFVEVRFSL